MRCPCGREINPSTGETFFPILFYFIIHHFVFAILPNLVTVLAYHFIILSVSASAKEPHRTSDTFSFSFVEKTDSPTDLPLQLLLSLSPIPRN